MKVLSRKPAKKLATTTAANSGQPGLDDDDGDDENDTTKTTLTMEERQQKAQREREEKQRKYEEARERLFGSEAAPASSSTMKQNGESRSQSRNKDVRENRPYSSAGNKGR